MTKEKARVICITPVKNEEWIIERFILATSLWADEIIVADQMSSDKTREILQRHSNVRIIDNDSKKFNENERQKFLISEARKEPGKKLLVALDADEFLTGNFVGSDEWNRMVHADPGTLFTMDWPCIAPDFKRYWMTDGESNIFAFMDDGTPHSGTNMHSIRVPVPSEAENIHLSLIKVMHFQYTDWARMKSKNLWYQCYERISNPEKSVFKIYRMYHHMDVSHNYEEIPEQWFEKYDRSGIDLRYNEDEDKHYWWDDEVEEFKKKYGEDYFKYIDFQNNRNIVLTYLRHTQFLWKYKYGKAFLRRLDIIIGSLIMSGNNLSF